jgi:hypothetical protein
MGPSRGGGEEAGDEGGDGENAMDNLGEEMERDLGEERSTGWVGKRGCRDVKASPTIF